MLQHDVRGVVIVVRLPDAAEFVYPEGTDANGKPLSPDTWFRVASITKLVTALAVLRLTNQGWLSLDDRIEQVLGDHPATRHGSTVRQVLAHISGLPLSWRNSRSPLDVEGGPPGTKFEYSNAGYDILGLVIEKVTGKSYEDVSQAEVLKPLEIEGVFGRVPSEPRIAALYGKEDHLNWPKLPKMEWPSGGLVTRPIHLIRLIAGFAFPPVGFLSNDVLLEALSDATGDVDHQRVPKDPAPPWGLGVELRGHKTRTFGGTHVGRDSFGHYGGSGCVVWHDPQTKLTWAILNSKTVGAGRTQDSNDWPFKFWGDIGDKVVPMTWAKIRHLMSGP